MLFLATGREEPLGQGSRQSRARSPLRAVTLRGLTHLGLLLMQLYLDVCELGPEVFIGSLKGDDERFGLLTLISPFLRHCSFLKGVLFVNAFQTGAAMLLLCIVGAMFSASTAWCT